jgi:diacylglycerol O-acyltransferase
VTDEPIPLTAEDRAILELECATVAGHTCKVILVDGPEPDLESLRATISARLARAPALTRKLGGDPDSPAWVLADDFDIAEQVDAVEGLAPLGEDELRAEVARLFEQRLDRDRPLWHLDVLTLEDERAALVWRIHHALADGTAAMRFANAVLWDEEPSAAPARPHPHEHAADDARRRGHLVKFVEREFGETFRRSPFDARVGTNRAIAFASVELAPLHDAAKSLAGATVNDAVLTIVAGGLRAWLEHHGGALGDVRVKVPVSLHHEGDDAGNRDSFFVLAVHLGEADPVARLAAIHAATTARKAEHDAERLDSLVDELRRVSPRLERLCKRIEDNPRRFALSVSNVPGPRTEVSVLGSPVDRVYSLAEIGQRHALRVAAVSLAGRLCFGFCADPSVVEDLDEMAAGLEADAAALIAASS